MQEKLSFFTSLTRNEGNTDNSQRAKKVVFDSPGLVDFAVGLVACLTGK